MQQRRRQMRWMMLAGLGAVCGFLAVLVIPMLDDGAAEQTPSQSPQAEPERPTAVAAAQLTRPVTTLAGETTALSLVEAAHTIVFAADRRPLAAQAGMIALALNAPLVLLPTQPERGAPSEGPATGSPGPTAGADGAASPAPSASASEGAANGGSEDASESVSPNASARDARAQAVADARRRGVVRAIVVGGGVTEAAREAGASDVVEIAATRLPAARPRDVISAAAVDSAATAEADDADDASTDQVSDASDDAVTEPATASATHAASAAPWPPAGGLDIADYLLPRAPTTGAALLVRPRAEEALAAVVTARAAGHDVMTTRASDLRADPDVGARLADLADGDDPPPLVLAGEAFAEVDPDAVAAHAAVAMTGVELPGGGQLVFDPDDEFARRYVGLYGVPQSPALGVLGEQPVPASVERAQQVADDYRAVVDDVTIIPSFEIIATVASSSAGDDGDYSNELPISDLRPAVDAAGDAGLYVLLDLQPGRTDFLTQAKRYRELLQEPHVGLALDPEWRLRPDEKHLAQIGSVGVDEVNEVTEWLADLVARERLPQKMLLLHQFRTSMIRERERLDTTRDELAFVVQMDGQGPQGTKLDTWAAIKADAPPRLRFGWKNFYDEDTPTRSPADTMALDPPPVFVSYQ